MKAREVVAVGDSESDMGLLRGAGLSVAYQPMSDRVRRTANHMITGSLDELLHRAK